LDERLRMWQSRTLVTLVILPFFHGHEGGSAGEDLMAELGFVVGLGLFVVLVGVVCGTVSAA
jgi:hypothetical protein